jgi:hypothetical protein
VADTRSFVLIIVSPSPDEGLDDGDVFTRGLVFLMGGDAMVT